MTYEIPPDPNAAPEVRLNPAIVDRARLPFLISLMSFSGLLALLFFIPIAEALIGRKFIISGDFIFDSSNQYMPILAFYVPHLLLFIITISSAYVGYKLLIAAGASPENPIPPGNYRLLAPLISEGKSEAIDQYVRLSSLSGFTGTFTKLGLTGLPLATVVLTLIFAALALLPISAENQKSFMDLTKLVLGAFIGSFVQRQVEQRRASTPVNLKNPARDQATTPNSSS